MTVRLLLTSGRGPAECRIALAHALKRMGEEACELGVTFDVVEGPAPDDHGPTSAVVVLSGIGAEVFAHSWTGTVLWVAESPVRPHHRRKNWFIGITRLPDSDDGMARTIEDGDVRFETFRAGGAGGQHQNKTESAVRAVHRPTGVAVVVREERSQHRNKALALDRLAELIDAKARLAREAEKSDRHAQHDALERGQPVRRFTGAAYREAPVSSQRRGGRQGAARRP